MSTPGPSHCKIQQVVDETTGAESEDESLPDKNLQIRQALNDIEECQKELSKLFKEFGNEVIELEAKYIKLRKPYYGKRAELIEKIPNFWVKVIVNHPVTFKLLDEHKENCLYHLRNLEVEEFENYMEGFKIKFIFDENPFFENLELVKELHLDQPPNDKPKSTSRTTIKWNGEKGQMDFSPKELRQLFDARRQRVLEPFVSWLSDNKDPITDDIAEAIKEDLWSDPLQYYYQMKEDGDKDDSEDVISDWAFILENGVDHEDPTWARVGEEKNGINSERVKAFPNGGNRISPGPCPFKVNGIAENKLGTAYYDPDLTRATRQALSDIEECQMNLYKLMIKATREANQLDTKYTKLLKPYYDKRAALIEKIPNFWANAIVNHPLISILAGEDGEDCVHFLKSLEVEEFVPVMAGFRVKFVFDENPFFSNVALVKGFRWGPNANAEPMSSSTVIKWKEQMDLSKKLPEIFNARRERGLKRRPFFSWFSDDKNPAAGDIGEVIKNDLWPNPLQYYQIPDNDYGSQESSPEEYEVEENLRGNEGSEGNLEEVASKDGKHYINNNYLF